MAKLVLGGESHSHPLAVTIGLFGIAGVVAFHFLGTWYSLAFPFRAKRLLELGVDPLRRFLFHHWDSRQNYEHVSAYARVNGRPPRNEIYERLAAANFKDWRLELSGMAAKKLSLSLDDLRQMPSQTQTTLHICIQGWSYFAQLTGVALFAIIGKCDPLPDSRFLAFHSFI